MKLSELISAYGDDAVKFQKLDDCTATLSMSKKGTKASFVTPETFGFDGFDKLGLIIWMDRERVAKILADQKSRQEPQVTKNTDGTTTWTDNAGSETR